MPGHKNGSTQTLPSGKDHGSFDAKRCLETVKSYGSGLTTKAEAILALHNTILQTGSVLGTSDGDPFPTYVQMLDEIDFASKSKAVVKRARQGENNGEGSDDVDEDRPSAKRKKPLVDESRFPWREASDRFRRELSPRLQETLTLLEDWSCDPEYVVRKIRFSPKCPEFPEEQWSNIVQGLPVDLDRILDSGIYNLGIGGCVGQYKAVETLSDWFVAFNKTIDAVSFAMPQRREEYLAWKNYIMEWFAATERGYHSRVIDFDKAARRQVANQKHLRLTDTAEFNDLRVVFLVSSDFVGGGSRSDQSSERQEVGGRRKVNKFI